MELNRVLSVPEEKQLLVVSYVEEVTQLITISVRVLKIIADSLARNVETMNDRVVYSKLSEALVLAVRLWLPEGDDAVPL